jgi:ligand-binding SRPBCC domain-containing protein
VFGFFEKPENLARITPPSMGFEILTPPPIRMRQGALIDYTVGVLGVRTRWTSLIAEYEPPHRFVDVQLKGPYSFWHHTHRFQEEKGGTRILDEVRYMMPMGILGRMAHALWVGRQLNRIFDYRVRVIDAHFGGKNPIAFEKDPVQAM